MAEPRTSEPRSVLIMGAAGRDFFNFLVVFKDDPTATRTTRT